MAYNNVIELCRFLGKINKFNKTKLTYVQHRKLSEVVEFILNPDTKEHYCERAWFYICKGKFRMIDYIYEHIQDLIRLDILEVLDKKKGVSNFLELKSCPVMWVSVFDNEYSSFKDLMNLLLDLEKC